MEKVERLRQLAFKRKADRLPGYYCLSDFHDGAYDRHEYVSPWTISANNADADLMILLQDWSSSDSLNGDLDTDALNLGYTPSLATNVSLIDLVKKHFGCEIDATYVTNLFVFIKKGGMSASIPMGDMKYCAEHYAVPQVEIVAPRLALCVGLNTFNALRLARGARRVRVAEATNRPFLINSTQVCWAPHTGYWGNRNAGGPDKIDEIWGRLAINAL